MIKEEDILLSSNSLPLIDDNHTFEAD